MANNGVFDVFQRKLGQLQGLVMQLLGERTMLSSYTAERAPEATPRHRADHVHRHQLVNGDTHNGYNSKARFLFHTRILCSELSLISTRIPEIHTIFLIIKKLVMFLLI